MDLAAYHENISETLARLAGQQALFDKAAVLMADAVGQGGLIHIIGTDMHTTSSVDEAFFRFGTLAAINPLFDPSISVTHNAARALYVKDYCDLGTFLVEYYRNLSKGDALVLLDNDSRSRLPVEVAKKAAELGLRVIAITSKAYTDAMPDGTGWEAEDGSTLYTMPGVSLVIDNAVPPFDALDPATGEGWVSAIANSFVLNALIMAARAELERRGLPADVWGNFGTPEGAARNQRLIDAYIDRVKHI